MNKLLVIDDDEDISAMLFILLRKDFDVSVVTKSEDIFPKIKNFQPDIILLDVFLTGYDGRVICKQLKFHPDSKHIPVIMVSGDDEILQTVGQYGANDFIQKPFEAETLLSKINNLVKIKSSSAG
ncbi:MAG: response regulator [Chitinophagaceae bacterium]|nr:response regulator [Chitinophagaceae bacterium]MDB5222912.1 response regulator [Chitinophagaceae bacterium]